MHSEGLRAAAQDFTQPARNGHIGVDVGMLVACSDLGGAAVEEAERRKIAAQTIALELGRLRAQADANGLDRLAYLTDIALVEEKEISPKG
jgi:hypothetical protein